MDLSKDFLDKILEEIAGYSVEIEPNPSLPHLGAAYLQRVLADCRKYQNRVQYYLQIVRANLKRVRLEIQMLEADIDLKTAALLSDDVIVRQQSSITDRKALSMTKLSEEHRVLYISKTLKMDLEETGKLIKMKYDQLKQTSNDIKTQRQIIKDDREFQGANQGGFSNPNVNHNGITSDGLPPALQGKTINPTDLLDPNKRPEELPEPVDAAHAEMIANFLNNNSKSKVNKMEFIPEEISKIFVSYDDLME